MGGQPNWIHVSALPIPCAMCLITFFQSRYDPTVSLVFLREVQNTLHSSLVAIQVFSPSLSTHCHAVSPGILTCMPWCSSPLFSVLLIFLNICLSVWFMDLLLPS